MRRKKREALKAKLKTQPSPLLAQALHHGNDSGPATPKAGDITPVSPVVASPASEAALNSPAPFQIQKDEDLANHKVETGEPEGDSPSAADYDPTLDMKEDRARHDHRLVTDGADLSSSAYDETKDSHDVPMPDAKPKKSSDDEFDMFAASSDDDDMFAEGPVKPTTKTKSKSKQLAANLLDNWDDHEGYYRIILGELLDGRYHVNSILGKGMFSAVVRAEDEQTGKVVAIKIIRTSDAMKKAGLKEIDILKTLSDADPDGKRCVIHLERSFEHKGHLCMVFENLSLNLREVLKKFGRDVGISLKAVRSYARQMFIGLTLLKKCNIVHADLKPDNMLVNDARNLMKICDLGSAAIAPVSATDITPYLVSRFYRAPEIMLGMPYDFAIDTWAVGCTLFELFTGKILFAGRNNNQMLRCIQECRGQITLKMLKKANLWDQHFDNNLRFKSAEKDPVTNKDVVKLLNFTKPTKDLKSRLRKASRGFTGLNNKDLDMFIDLLEKCLLLNPEKRITPADALNHPFLKSSASL
ncbi:kinase-like protein [Microthyrium microscopicum]|uniref:non-specific serine/threonine protein kinase n=1 Tax=Microthyrium microscopicum TaxID=703497 RepID=A0A6A6TVP4_9PEZI|nr:kinase-like protein [Microthyrium microscopicum]